MSDTIERWQNLVDDLWGFADGPQSSEARREEVKQMAREGQLLITMMGEAVPAPEGAADSGDVDLRIPDSLRDGFRQFARNFRWGTCADCPRDHRRDAYPELCIFTDRYDHQLTAEGLAEQVRLRMREALNAGR